MDFHDDDTSNDIFYNSYMRLEGELKVGDRFCTKEECMRAIKKFHMDNSVDFNVKCTDSRRYVIVACTHTPQDAYNRLSDVYKAINIMNVYNESFVVLAIEEYWPPYQGDIVWHNDEIRRKKKGRPNSTHIRTEMDTAEKIIRLYSICRQSGHNRKNCPNLGAPSTS